MGLFNVLKQEFYLPQGAAFRPEQQKWPWHGVEDTKMAWSHLCPSPGGLSAVPRSGGAQGFGMEAVTGQESLEEERHLRE